MGGLLAVQAHPPILLEGGMCLLFATLEDLPQAISIRQIRNGRPSQGRARTNLRKREGKASRYTPAEKPAAHHLPHACALKKAIPPARTLGPAGCGVAKLGLARPSAAKRGLA